MLEGMTLPWPDHGSAPQVHRGSGRHRSLKDYLARISNSAAHAAAGHRVILSSYVVSIASAAKRPRRISSIASAGAHRGRSRRLGYIARFLRILCHWRCCCGPSHRSSGGRGGGNLRRSRALAWSRRVCAQALRIGCSCLAKTCGFVF